MERKIIDSGFNFSLLDQVVESDYPGLVRALSRREKIQDSLYSGVNVDWIKEKRERRLLNSIGDRRRQMGLQSVPVRPGTEHLVRSVLPKFPDQVFSVGSLDLLDETVPKVDMVRAFCGRMVIDLLNLLNWDLEEKFKHGDPSLNLMDKKDSLRELLLLGVDHTFGFGTASEADFLKVMKTLLPNLATYFDEECRFVPDCCGPPYTRLAVTIEIPFDDKTVIKSTPLR